MQPRVTLYSLLLATNAADVATTGLGLSAGLVESNPASAALLALGFPVWVAAKTLVLAAVGLAAELLPAWVVDPPVMLATTLTGLAALTNVALVLGVVA